MVATDEAGSWLDFGDRLIDEGRNLRNNAVDLPAADGCSFWLAGNHRYSVRSIAAMQRP
jgi:hypothetical protein